MPHSCVSKIYLCFQVILGVDRADYTKGLVNRFQAYERLLSDYPDFRGKVMMFQVSLSLSQFSKHFSSVKVLSKTINFLRAGVTF